MTHLALLFTALGFTQWPAGADTSTKPAKPVNHCDRPGCGAVYSGTTHVCRNPAKETR